MLVEEFRHAVRSLRSRWPLTVIGLACWAGAVGAASSVFGVVDTLVFRPPAGVHDPGAIVRIHASRDAGDLRTSVGSGLSYPDYAALRGTSGVFTDVSASAPLGVDFDRGERAQRLRGVLATDNYFSVLGVRPAAGRFFSSAEERISFGSPAEAVLSYEFWRRELAGDPDVAGRSIWLNGRSFTVVGVAPERFTGLDPEPVDVWVPMGLAEVLQRGDGWLENPRSSWLSVHGRLALGITQERAVAAAEESLGRSAQSVEGLDRTPSVVLTSGRAALGAAPSHVWESVFWLALAALVLLVGATAMVARLLGVRRASSEEPAPEVRVVLVESVILALLGGMLGLVVALGTGSLLQVFPLPPGAEWRGARITAFAVVVSLVLGVLAGIPAALQAHRERRRLKDASSSEPDRLRHSGPGRLVTAQITLAVMLIAAGGLIARTHQDLWSAETGMDADRLLLASVDLQRAGFSAAEEEAFYGRALQRLQAIPGVERASFSQLVPFREVVSAAISVPGRYATRRPNTGPYVNYVGADFLATVGTPLLAGRAFTAADGPESAPVALVNRAMAEHYWGTADEAIGQCIRTQAEGMGAGCMEVIGVAADGMYMRLDEASVPVVYFPFAQRDDHAPRALWIRTSGDPKLLIPVVRREIAGLAPDLPFVDVQAMTDVLRPQLLPLYRNAVLLFLLGSVALLLAVAGLYTTTLRTLGRSFDGQSEAKPGDGVDRDSVRRIVLHALRPTLFGVVAGWLGALVLVRSLPGSLYEVNSFDPVTFGGVLVLFLTVLAVACYLPARQALRPKLLTVPGAGQSRSNVTDPQIVHPDPRSQVAGL